MFALVAYKSTLRFANSALNEGHDYQCNPTSVVNWFETKPLLVENVKPNFKGLGPGFYHLFQSFIFSIISGLPAILEEQASYFYGFCLENIFHLISENFF
jgi:hypothetical protein